MRYVMKMACDSLSQCSIVRRFIDDIMMIFMGSLESAENIKRCLSEIFTGQHLSLTFRHAHSENSIENSITEVEFMDINHILDPSDIVGFITRDFIKPTAIDRVFLHGSSYHPISTFKSILKGECLRMRWLNELKQDFDNSLVRQNKSSKIKFPQASNQQNYQQCH